MQSVTHRLATSRQGAGDDHKTAPPRPLSTLGSAVIGVVVAATAPGAAHEHEQRIRQRVYTVATTLPTGSVHVASREILDRPLTERGNADGPITACDPAKRFVLEGHTSG